MSGRERRHLLILGGTAEARVLAEQASALLAQQLCVTTSLAGRTRETAALAGEVRRGGFGGVDGLAAYLQAARIDFVVDATHPFATRISKAAQEACRLLALPLLALTRTAWEERDGDRWITVENASEAAAILPRLGRRAFLTIGHSEIAAFSGIDKIHFLVRLVDPPAAALPLVSHEVILGRGPFTFAAERHMMERYAIDMLVAKASGGSATAAKLDAARALDIPVVMLRRPIVESGKSVESVAEALAWIAGRLAESEEVLP